MLGLFQFGIRNIFVCFLLFSCFKPFGTLLTFSEKLIILAAFSGEECLLNPQGDISLSR